VSERRRRDQPGGGGGGEKGEEEEEEDEEDDTAAAATDADAAAAAATPGQLLTMEEKVQAVTGEILSRQTKTPRTLGANRLATDCAETMGLDFFRFLVLERNLRDYVILHYVHYSSRLFLNGFITPKLQKRHELRHVQGTDLERSVLKNILNGNHAIVKTNRFFLTTIFCCRFLWLRRDSIIQFFHYTTSPREHVGQKMQKDAFV
jgi:hypothetical protein